MKSMTTFNFLSFLLIMTLNSCAKSDNTIEDEYSLKTPENAVLQMGRKLGVSPSDGINGFSSTFVSMQEVGVNRVELNLDWTYFEKDKEIYEDQLDLLNAVGFYGQNGIDIGLSLANINTVRRTDPTYLNTLNYDDDAYIMAYINLIDWIMENLSSEVTVDYLSIGNEVNYVLSGEDWDAYGTFFLTVKDHIKTNYPSIKVGVKMTLGDGLLSDDKDRILDIINISDVALLNYYPQSKNFKVYSIDQAINDLNQMLSLIDKEIYLTEIGFQSGGNYCNSSEEQQGLFYHELFKWWDDNHRQVPFLQINWMHDVSKETLAEFEDYYGFSDPGFIEYLATLGLKNHDESPKLAWEQLLIDTKARAWE